MIQGVSIHPDPSPPREKSGAPTAPPPNTELGPYTLVNRIAVGGMAEVFRALEPRKVGEPRLVVLKRLLPHLAAEPSSYAMFEDEARLGGRIAHPNVVHVFEHGNAGGIPYLVLEYVPGCDLWRLSRTLTRRGKSLETTLAIYVIREILAGLQAVHEATDEHDDPLGIIHRDISPSNILVSTHGEVKIADFGIARARFLERFPKAQGPARAKGKLGYLAPEQVSGGEVDLRADVFATAVVAAELLMRRPLFTGGSELAVLLAIRDAEVHPFEEFASSLPDGLGTAILRALAVSPDERPRSAREFRDMLAPFAPGDPEALRQGLAEVVCETVTARVNRSGPTDLLSLEAPPLTPPARGGDRRTTADVPRLEYRVRKPNGALVGPIRYAKVIEAAATGQITIEDQVSVAGGEFQPVAAVPDIFRHMPASQFTPTTAQLAPKTLASKGLSDFEDGGFIRALARTVLDKKSGLWLCQQGGVRKEVYAHSGVPTFVTSNLAGELLGEHLVKQRVINRSELDMALAVIPRFEGKLGDTLVALGLVEPVALFQHIGDQVREKLLDLFTWETGTATFYEGIDPPSSGFPLGLNPWEIFDEGLRRRIAAGLENDLVLNRSEHRVKQVEHLPTSIATADFPEAVEELLRHTTSPVTVDALVQIATEWDLDDPQWGFRIIALLLYMDVIEWVQ